MKVVNIIGSPRSRGNSAGIAQLLLEQPGLADSLVRSYELNRLTYRGCQGCMACKTKLEKCVVQDDLTYVLEDIRTADVVVFSSPVYFGEITAQAAGLIHRGYSFLGNDYRTNPKPSRLAPGKKLVLILSQGNKDENAFAELVPRYTRIFGRLGFEEVQVIRGLGLGPESDPRKQEDILKRVKAVAEKLV